MIERDPLAWSIGTWFLAIGMAAAGGLINWYAKIKRGHARAFNIVELLGEMFTSAVVGLAVFMTLASYDFPTGACAAASGVGGHMATRLLFIIERAIEEWMDHNMRDRLGCAKSEKDQ